MPKIDRVLLVDDEPILLGPLRRLIQRVHPGALVVYASSPQMAEWQLRTTAIQLVVTDLRMGGDELAGMRVVEVAREVGVTVAVLTAADDATLAELRKAEYPVVSKRASITSAINEIVEHAFRAA